ncbi:hypothetical protein RND71_016181 [Anisodus tanguticus]|uniref:Uncharacterized protein n=1 Tax=Anisodus tanguticus TaxID=243964 RepID=A0AAE1VCG5_9SOLA|nr:hypothetical protein RND71_016181 [Anisodus tanguticus]
MKHPCKCEWSMNLAKKRLEGGKSTTYTSPSELRGPKNVGEKMTRVQNRHPTSQSKASSEELAKCAVTYVSLAMIPDKFRIKLAITCALGSCAVENCDIHAPNFNVFLLWKARKSDRDSREWPGPLGRLRTRPVGSREVARSRQIEDKAGGFLGSGPFSARLRTRKSYIYDGLFCERIFGRIKRNLCLWKLSSNRR